SRKDGEAFARDLCDKLQSHNVSVWQDRARMEGGKRSGNPSFVSALKLRISCLVNQRARRGEHGSTADGALPGTGGGISGIGSEGERAGRSHCRAAAGACALVRPRKLGP